MNTDFLRSILEKLEWKVLCNACKEIGEEPLPEEVSEEMLQDAAFLQQLHHVLVEVVIVEGSLICPESGRVFPIQNGIPNMLLNEDEV